MKRKFAFGLAALVCACASVFFAAPAAADTQPDPQLSNVPYLAWRGEEVRLVKCHPDILASFGIDGQQAQQLAQSAQFGLTFVDFLLVDWSGDPHTIAPQLEPGTVSMFFRSWDGAPCVAGTFVSQKAGLAQIKLVVTFNMSQGNGAPNGPETITLKHDFNVAWMNISSANLAVTSGGTTDTAGGPGNELQVLVKGQFPLLQNYTELGLGDSLTMPDDWARLARAIATSNSPFHPDPALLWDIHDEFSPTASPDADRHGAQSSCPVHNTSEFVDDVDNCEPALPPGIFTTAPVATPYEIGAFSRVWAFFTNPTIGPFDPQRAGETLLSNGILDQGDAPMPAALINFEITPNTGGAGDISGVGSFCVIGDGNPTPPGQCRAVDKHIVYSRDGLGSVPPSPAAPHNLYGPFYATWIPATGPALFGPFIGVPRPEASGITGPLNANEFNCGVGNNFNGFQAGADCFYHYWDVAQVLRCGPGGAVQPSDPVFGENGLCINQEVPAVDCPPFVAGESPQLPSGAQHIDVYTDEHGEARVRFSPGTQFFFGNLPFVPNANGGCDIAGINVLGTAAITAQAKYPFQPVTARPVNSNTVTKTVTSAFAKTLQCFPKGPGAQNAVAAICVAQALDITGNPFVGETICFVADFNASDIQHFVGTINGITIGDAGRNAAAEAQGLRRICPFTDANGRAAVEVFNSNPTTVDVTAFFVDEGILRSLKVQFPITAPTAIADGTQAPQTTPTPTGGTTPTTQPNTNTNTNTQPNTSRPGVTYRIAKLRLVRQTRVKAYALVRVTGPAGTVRLRFRIAARNGRATTAIRTVRTGRLVTVPNLRTPRVRGALRVSASIVS